MNRILLFFLSALFSTTALAQFTSNGYYRVQNVGSSRYIDMIDNKTTGFSYAKTAYDIDALVSRKPFSWVASDPGSVIYVESKGNSMYNLKAQGTDAYKVVTRYLKLTRQTLSNGKYAYFASATEQGITLYLYDQDDDGENDEGRLYTMKTGSNLMRLWYITPISATDDSNYFGVDGKVTAGGKQYTTFYASFPFTFTSSAMKAYIVKKVDGDMAVWQEVSGKIAASTPVIIACAGTSPSQNRLNLELQDGTAPSGNLLKGVYFENSQVEYIARSLRLGTEPFHLNVTPNDPNTMRLLGVTSKGKLGFVKSDVKYVPQNSAYLKVAAGSPDEITLMTQAEYDQAVALDVVTVTANNKQRVYGDANPAFDYVVSGTGTINGQPTISCEATQESPVGTYPIVVGKGSVSNHTFNAVNGTLTVTKAPLTVTARSYTIKQNEALPQFAVDYAGFKLGQTNSVFTAQPVITCNVPADKTPGTYPITVSGITAQNYEVSYVAGTLTIQQADPITVKATSLKKEYGDAVPQLTWTVEGGTLTGQPQLSCQATPSSAPGTYAITVSKGTLDYPNLVFVDGTLTVTKAPLTISAGGPYTMKQTDERPTFQPVFEGFKLNETQAVLTSQPVLTTNAPDDNTPGEYVVSVSGAESPNYDITYVPGRLIITEADEIVLVVADATMVYGDEVPAFTYTVSGGEIEGEPVVKCEATSRSSVGAYAITLERGTITYPNLRLVPGTLTVTKAPLVASVGNYVRTQGDPNPTFVVLYDGFRNGDTEEAIAVKPVATTEADAASTPGTYDIVVSGGEAQNYAFTYVNGILTVEVRTAVQTVTFRAPVDVYTVTGRLVRRQATTTAGLPAGLYVVEGRKVIVK